jgi:hypothetical protein
METLRADFVRLPAVLALPAPPRPAPVPELEPLAPPVAEAATTEQLGLF